MDGRGRDKAGYVTIDDFLSGNWGEPSELVDGRVYFMSPVSKVHQEIVGALHVQLSALLEGDGMCRVYLSPYAVRLFKERDMLLAPDLFVVCDAAKLRENACDGAPDMIVEALSPSSRRHDRVLKYNLYRQAGVKEYWIIDPEIRAIDVYVLKDGEYFHNILGDAGLAKIRTLSGAEVDLAKIFPANWKQPKAAPPGGG